jgi:outer membrane receptor protein involved in Fe transport
LSAKSQTASDVLQRIPAGEVLRIELLRGSEAAGDASGAALLANVVRTPSSGGGAWSLGAELANRDRAAPNGWFGWGGRRGVTEYSLGGSTYALQRELPGERDVRDGVGLPSARRASTSPREFAEYALNGQAARPMAGGRLALTGQAHYSRYHEDSTLLTTSPAGAQLENEFVPYTESERTGELGLAYQRDAGNWSLELSALATRKQYHSHVRSTQFGDDEAQDLEFTQALARDSGETILRGTLGRAHRAGRLEAGAEVALNTLEGAMQLALDSGSGPFPINVPNANLDVKEKRAEAFVSHAWTIDGRWSLDSRLAAETSWLDFTGDTNQSVSLTYVKPRVQVTRKLGAHQLQARVYRDVGQLDFTDFVSAAEVSDDVINGGNPNLKPQTAWAAEVDADLRHGEAALRLRGFHHWLDDVVDLIPAGPPAQRIDAPGNIGRGTLTGVEISARVPLSRLLPGASLKAAGTFQDAEVRDAVTGRHRTISGFPARRLRMDLREDIPGAKLTWGVSWTAESESVKYRLIERDSARKSRQLDAFVETTALEGLTLRLTLLSILDDAQLRERRFYSPDRAGSLAETETSRWHPGRWWLISMSGSF